MPGGRTANRGRGSSRAAGDGSDPKDGGRRRAGDCVDDAFRAQRRQNPWQGCHGAGVCGRRHGVAAGRGCAVRLLTAVRGDSPEALGGIIRAAGVRLTAGHAAPIAGPQALDHEGSGQHDGQGAGDDASHEDIGARTRPGVNHGSTINVSLASVPAAAETGSYSREQEAGPWRRHQRGSRSSW
jgi:hypothetical protein